MEDKNREQLIVTASSSSLFPRGVAGRKRMEHVKKGLRVVKLSDPEESSFSELLVWDCSHEDCWCETLAPTTVASPRGILIKYTVVQPRTDSAQWDGGDSTDAGGFRGSIIFCQKAEEPSCTLGSGKLICCMPRANHFLPIAPDPCLSCWYDGDSWRAGTIFCYLFSSWEKSAHLSGSVSRCDYNRDPNWQ